jgi:hypothetical protein
MGSVREVGYREKGVLVEDIAIEESPQQGPRHWKGLNGEETGWS